MGWIKLDDQFFTHPKIVNLSKDAKLLYLACLTYSSSHLTDGALSGGAMRVLVATVEANDEAIACLVASGLLQTTSKQNCEYQIHDYLQYQQSREHVLKVREARTSAGKVGGEHSGTMRSKTEAKPKQNRSKTPSKIEAEIEIELKEEEESENRTEEDVNVEVVVGEGGSGGKSQENAATTSASSTPSSATATPMPSVTGSPRERVAALANAPPGVQAEIELQRHLEEAAEAVLGYRLTKTVRGGLTGFFNVHKAHLTAELVERAAQEAALYSAADRPRLPYMLTVLERMMYRPEEGKDSRRNGQAWARQQQETQDRQNGSGGSGGGGGGGGGGSGSGYNKPRGGRGHGQSLEEFMGNRAAEAGLRGDERQAEAGPDPNGQDADRLRLPPGRSPPP